MYIQISKNTELKEWYKTVSADINMKNQKIKTSVVKPEGPKAKVSKTGIDFMIFILIFVKNSL